MSLLRTDLAKPGKPDHERSARKYTTEEMAAELGMTTGSLLRWHYKGWLHPPERTPVGPSNPAIRYLWDATHLHRYKLIRDLCKKLRITVAMSVGILDGRTITEDAIPMRSRVKRCLQDVRIPPKDLNRVSARLCRMMSTWLRQEIGKRYPDDVDDLSGYWCP